MSLELVAIFDDLGNNHQSLPFGIALDTPRSRDCSSSIFRSRRVAETGSATRWAKLDRQGANSRKVTYST